MNNVFLFFIRGLPVTCIMIAAAFFLRFLLRKQSKRLVNVIWVSLLFRLLCPVTVEGELGIIPQKMILSDEVFASINQSYEAVDTSVYSEADMMEAVSGNESIENVQKESLSYGETEFQLEVLLMGIWAVGFCGMLLYTALHIFVIRDKQNYAVVMPGYDNVYRWKDQTAPCVIGVIHPRIYVPANIEKDDLDMVIRHENAHIQRKDYLFILLYYLALCIYWFNPLCWLLYRRVQADIEMACDEHVLLEAKVVERQAYSRALLHLCTGQSVKAGWALSFGKGSLKQRIQDIGQPKKYNKLIALLAVVVCGAAVLIGAFVSTDAKKYDDLIEQMAQSHFGADNPRICYADEDTVIFYDDKGVFVYSMEDERISGYASYQGTNFGATQGDYATFVEVSADGRYVYGYNDYGEHYCYDVKADHFETTEPLELSQITPDPKVLLGITEPSELSQITLWQGKLYEGDVNETDTLYCISNAYETGEQAYCYLGFEPVDTDTYEALRIVLVEDGNMQVYHPFEK